MTGDKPPDDEDRSLFERAMRGVSRVARRGPGVVSARPARAVAPAALADRAVPPAARFLIEWIGERVEGVAPDASRGELERLRDGREPVQVALDLHGLGLEEARHRVRTALREALEQRQRRLLFIHGRGLHSADGPVVKRALPGWLGEPPHGRHVLAFVSAPSRLGGDGALLVLLRRARGQRGRRR